MIARSALDELGLVLKGFRPVLRSMDVRTVAVRLAPNEGWINLVTSILISEKTVNEVKDQQKSLLEVSENEFKIFLGAWPFEDSIFDQITKGSLLFKSSEELSTVQTRQFDLLKLKVFSSWRNLNGSVQCVLCAMGGGSPPQEREKLWAVSRSQNAVAKVQNYSSIQELISHVLKIEISDGEHKDFEVTIGSLAKIDWVGFVNSSFEAKISKLCGVRDLQLNLNLKRFGSGYSKTIWRQIIPIEESEQEPTNNCIVAKSVKIDDLVPFDQMDAELIHKISALTIDSKQATVPLKNLVEPVLKTLGAFCSLADFKKMLLEPQMFGKEPQKIFETAVCWLLSLAGLNPICLSTKIKDLKGKDRKFDSLKIESGFDVGCADIIAYKDNDCLLLVDCDIGSINETKIQRLLATSKHFEASLNTYGKLRFVPVLFTTKECEQQSETGVRLVGKNVIEIIFEELVKGNRDEAASQIVSSNLLMWNIH